MFIQTLVFDNFRRDGYSLPMTKSGCLLCGLGGQIPIVLEDINETKGKSDLTKKFLKNCSYLYHALLYPCSLYWEFH